MNNALSSASTGAEKAAFCEVKAKGGTRWGDPLEMVGTEKLRRLRRAAETWLATHPECTELEVAFEVVGVRDGRLVRVDASYACG